MTTESIALSILTSIITGGFVLVLVEIGNRKNRENDRYELLMHPFMHKLSAYFRFIGWCKSHIIYPQTLNDSEANFKALVNKIGGYGGKSIVSGDDYGIDYFNAEELYNITFDINNIWYWHDKMHPNRLDLDNAGLGTEFINKELKEISSMYVELPISIDSVAKVSGEFYTDIYQPIEYETYRHERHIKFYKKQTFIICSFVCFVLLLLVLMLCCELPESFIQRSTVAVVVMLICSLLMLAIDVKIQLKWLCIASNYITNNRVVRFVLNKTIKRCKKDSRKQPN